MSVKISIITATFNSATTVGATIESVNQQRYKNFEHIFVDGYSTDDTLSVLRRHARKDAVIDSQRDDGIYDALNRGIGLSKGDIVGFLHSDDCLASEETLSKIAKVFEDPNVSVCYGDLEYVSARNTSKVVRYWRAGAFNLKSLQHGWMPPHPTVYIRKSLLKKMPFRLNYLISADYEWILRIFKTKDITAHYIPEVIVKMRLGGASNRSFKNIWQKTKEDLQAIKLHNIGGIPTLILKNLRKMTQFINHRKKEDK